MLFLFFYGSKYRVAFPSFLIHVFASNRLGKAFRLYTSLSYLRFIFGSVVLALTLQCTVTLRTVQHLPGTGNALKEFFFVGI